MRNIVIVIKLYLDEILYGFEQNCKQFEDIYFMSTKFKNVLNDGIFELKFNGLINLNNIKKWEFNDNKQKVVYETQEITITIWNSFIYILRKSSSFLLFLLIIFIIMFIVEKIFREKEIKIKFQYKEKWIYLIILCVLTIIFYLLIFNRWIIHIVGWHIYYAKMLLGGKMVYRDFYYYLPPFYLLFCSFIIKLTRGSILVFRVYGILERVILQIFIYLILQRYFKAKYVWIAVFISGLLCFNTWHDGFGDYNDTRIFIVVIGLYCSFRFLESINTKKEYKWIFLTGICMAVGTLCVQTTLLVPIVFFLALVFICIIQKNNHLLIYFGIAITSFLIPVAITALWLLTNDAMMPFIQQVFLKADSKGDMGLVTLNVFKNFWEIDSIGFCFCSAIILYFYKNKENLNQYSKLKKIIYNITLIATIHFGIQLLLTYINSFLTATIISKLTVFLEILVLLTIIYLKKVKQILNMEEKDRNIVNACFITFMCFISFYFITSIDISTISSWFKTLDFYSLKSDVVFILFLFNI